MWAGNSRVWITETLSGEMHPNAWKYGFEQRLVLNFLLARTFVAHENLFQTNWLNKLNWLSHGTNQEPKKNKSILPIKYVMFQESVQFSMPRQAQWAQKISGLPISRQKWCLWYQNPSILDQVWYPTYIHEKNATCCPCPSPVTLNLRCAFGLTF